MAQRFTIKRSASWKPLLVLFGANDARSWVELDEKELIARFGYYRLAIPWANVETAEPASWPWYGGIGWRTDFRHTIGLIGATAPVVRIHLAPAMRVRVLRIPIQLTDLYVTLDDPDGFIEAVGSRQRHPASTA